MRNQASQTNNDHKAVHDGYPVHVIVIHLQVLIPSTRILSIIFLKTDRVSKLDWSLWIK